MTKVSSSEIPPPTAINASQGTEANEVIVRVDTPDTQSITRTNGTADRSAATILYMSYTPEFADAEVVGYTGSVLGGREATFVEDGFPFWGFANFLLDTKTRAPQFYFWAVTEISGSSRELSEPVGPVSGWASNRDETPTIYAPAPEPQGASLRAEVPENSTVGQGPLRAKANLPGTFTYDPEEGTRLPTGNYSIEITFTPSVSGYFPVTQTFDYTVTSSGVRWFGSSESTPEGWDFSNWLGLYFLDPDDDRWVYSYELGWLYTASTDEADMQIFSPRLGWFWTSEASYPYMFSLELFEWFYIDRSASNLSNEEGQRYFYFFDTDGLGNPTAGWYTGSQIQTLVED